MSNEPKTYKIRNVADFLMVPEDRRAVCLKEFFSWLAMADTVRKISELMPNVAVAEMSTDAFNWVDDDKGEARITVNVRGKLQESEDEGKAGSV